METRKRLRVMLVLWPYDKLTERVHSEVRDQVHRYVVLPVHPQRWGPNL